VLFSIPRSLLLNTVNSKLSSLLKPEEWSSLKNWTPLILVMMWESKQPDSRWREYLDIMPTTFDSLMFWSPENLAELQGSTIVGT
jgi:SET domain-containing protein 6